MLMCRGCKAGVRFQSSGFTSKSYASHPEQVAIRYTKESPTIDHYTIPSAKTVLNTELCNIPLNHNYAYPPTEFLSFSSPSTCPYSQPAQISRHSTDLRVVDYTSDCYLVEPYHNLFNNSYSPAEDLTLVKHTPSNTPRRQNKKKQYCPPAATGTAIGNRPQRFNMDHSQYNGQSSRLATIDNGNNNIDKVKREVKQSRLNPAAAMFVPTVQKQYQQPETEAPPVNNANLGPAIPPIPLTKSGPAVVIGTSQDSDWGPWFSSKGGVAIRRP